MKKEVRLSSEIFSEVVSEMKAEKMEGTKTGIVDWFENPYYLGIRLVPEYFYPNQIRIVEFENKYRGTDEKSSLVIKITYEFSDEEIDLPPTDEE